MSTPTDWGVVEKDVIAYLADGLVPDDSRGVKSAISEDAADMFPKGINSVFVVDRGTSARTSPRSGNGYLRQDEVWGLDIYIYSASGKVQDSDRWAIKTLAAKVKGILNAYTPNGQVDNCSCLELQRDQPVEGYSTEASSGLKIRQSYLLKTLLQSQVTGPAAA